MWRKKKERGKKGVIRGNKKDNWGDDAGGEEGMEEELSVVVVGRLGGDKKERQMGVRGRLMVSR